jgi:hypothetical protein
MSFEADFRALLLTVCPQVYPDVTPDAGAVFPCLIYQQVGGQAYAYMEKRLPDHKHARMQVSVWADSRVVANALARQVEKALVESPFAVEPYGAFVATYEPAIKKYGSRQDFGVFYPDP